MCTQIPPLPEILPMFMENPVGAKCYHLSGHKQDSKSYSARNSRRAWSGSWFQALRPAMKYSAPKVPPLCHGFSTVMVCPWKAWYSREGYCYNINKASFPFMGFNSELQCLHHFFFCFCFALLVIFFSSYYLVLWNTFQPTLNPFTSPQVCLRLINVLAMS